MASSRTEKQLFSFNGKSPVVQENVFIAPGAMIIGDVIIESGANIWFNAVVRGDLGRIRIGAGASIQDLVTIHVPEGGETIIGENAVIGHGCVLEGCQIGRCCVIGMNSTVLTGAVIGSETMLAAGTVVPEGVHIPPRVLAAGVPVSVRKPLEGRSLEWVKTAATSYHRLRTRYLQNQAKQSRT